MFPANYCFRALWAGGKNWRWLFKILIKIMRRNTIMIMMMVINRKNMFWVEYQSQ